MKIGEVAERTGVPQRMIRYYESQGLLEPERGSNRYRVYSEEDVERVRRIRNHIAAGMPTRVIKVILEMEQPTWTQQCSADFAGMLAREVEAIEERIACLSMSRQTLRDYLDRVQVR